MTCRACTTHSRAYSSIVEALRETSLEFGGPEVCSCPEVETPPDAGVFRSLSVLLAGGIEGDRYGECTHVVRAMAHETRGTCRVCWRLVPLFPALPLPELISAAEDRALEADGLAAGSKGASARLMREVARRARWQADRLREIAARTVLDQAAE